MDANDRIDIVTAYVNGVTDIRFNKAQQNLLRSCLEFNLNPIFYSNNNINEPRPKFGDMLWYARQICSKTNSRYIWFINSDCSLNKDPRSYITENICYGIHRTEIPSMKYCEGVDMYVIPVDLYDKHLSEGYPDMYVGATHIDWWISQFFEHLNKYKAIKDNVIFHTSHTVTPQSGCFGNNIHDHNVSEFFKWKAKKGF